MQSSVAVAPPSAVFIVAEDGLHPNVVDAVDVGETMGAA